jgi:hypothetical protein
MAYHKTTRERDHTSGEHIRPRVFYSAPPPNSRDDGTSVEAAVSAATPRPSQAARLPLQLRQLRLSGFTLAELLVSIGVLVLLVFLATQLLNSAATITTLSHKQMDVDSQAREVLDRMAIDLAQMIKRSDVDYYLKSPSTPQSGNDQLAFYSAVPGYYPTSPGYTRKSPLSLVSYRINSLSTSASYNRMERMGKGLAWNGFSSSSDLVPIMFLPQTISGNWPSAVNTSAVDSAYEIIGPQVFRFEYYYLLKGQTCLTTGTTYPPIFSATPWDTRIDCLSCCPSPPPTPAPTATPTATPTPAGTPTPAPTPPVLCCHTSPQGMQDVAAIIVDIAVIDPKSRTLVTDCQLAKLNGAPPPPSCSQEQILVDYAVGMTPGQLLTQWRAAIDSNTVRLPPPAISGVRVYERCLYLSPPTLLTP